jgi:dTDP-4-amino-4,6-dideoxygalactose transaminase
MIPFSPPKITDELVNAVIQVLRSGWITTGPRTKEFEKQVTQYCGCKSTLCLNSATAGLEIMLHWFGVTKGDEVIVPAYTYSATANVVMHCGAKVIFVDVNKEDFNVSVEKIEKAITSRTKVIMPVDFAGFPCDYNAINALVNRKDIRKKFKANTPEQKKLKRILILSDSAHSIGATYKGKKAGSLADASVFSFHAVKNLITAEGGAICLNLPTPFDNEAIYKALCVKSLHGQNKDALAKSKVGGWRYDIVEAGYKCNMTDIAAVMGISELKSYESDTLPKRKKICDAYARAFAKYSWAEIPVHKTETSESCYHLFALRIKGIKEAQRDEIMKNISEKDVSVNVHFIPVPMMSFYKKLGYKIKDYPNAYDNFSREISLPVFYDLTDEQAQTVIEAVVSSVQKVIK